MVRARGFSIVLHDVQKGRKTKEDVCDFLTSYKVKQYVIAEEPYNHQEGSHIHVFVQMSQPVQFKQMLDRWCKYWGATGRVQVDQLRGSMASACKYVNGQASKQKAYDPEPIVFLVGGDAEEAEVEDADWIMYGPKCCREVAKASHGLLARCPVHRLDWALIMGSESEERSRAAVERLGKLFSQARL